MSKLQRAVEGQTIQFLPLPKIFNTLSSDLPSGAVKLPNGEVAYWRLHRNLAELKKHRKNVKDLTTKLAQALGAIVNSDSFKNHYGIAEAPQLPSESQLVTLFRNLLQLNTNRVDYSSVSHGRNKPLVESIQVPLGNLVFFNAVRGVQSAPKVAGIKGKLWLKEGSDADQAYAFTIVSPVVELADFIGPDRLQAEILSKIKMNLPALAFNPKVTFDDGQFAGYVGAGLQALGEKFQGQPSKKDKKPPKTQNSSLSGAHVQLPTPNDPSFIGTYQTQEAFDQLVDPKNFKPGSWANVAGRRVDIVSAAATSEVDPLYLGEFVTQEDLEASIDTDKFVVGNWAMVAGERINIELKETEDDAGADDFAGDSVQIGEGARQFAEEFVAQQAEQKSYGTSPAEFVERETQRQAPLGSVVLTAQVFNQLSNDDKGTYLAAVERKLADAKQWPFVKSVMESGILHDEWSRMNESLEEGEKISQPVYIGRVIFQMTRDLIGEVLGEHDAFNAANGIVRA